MDKESQRLLGVPSWEPQSLGSWSLLSPQLQEWLRPGGQGKGHQPPCLARRPGEGPPAPVPVTASGTFPQGAAWTLGTAPGPRPDGILSTGQGATGTKGHTGSSFPSEQEEMGCAVGVSRPGVGCPGAGQSLEALKPRLAVTLSGRLLGELLSQGLGLDGLQRSLPALTSLILPLCAEARGRPAALRGGGAAGAAGSGRRRRGL